MKIGEDDQTKIDFETADEIHFYAANVEQVYLGDNIFGPQSDSDVDLGSNSVRWKDAYVDSVTSTGNVVAGGTIEPGGDTSAGDNAAIGYTSAEGLILTGQGSTSDITLKNDADATVFTVPTGTDDILFPDNAKAMFGAGSDLQIYHNGFHSLIQDTGTGNLYLDANSSINLRNADGSENYATFTQNGAVNLYHDNALKLATTATGVAVTGNATFADNGKAIFGAGSDLQIYHDGSSSRIVDAGTGNLLIQADELIIRNAAGNETKADYTTNGAVNLYYDNAAKLATASGGVTVTGDIANASGAMTIDIAGDLNLDADGGNVLFKDGGTEIGRLSNSSSNLDIRSSVSDKVMFFTVNGSERMRIDTSGNLLVGRTNASASTATSGGGSVLNADGLIEATKNGTVAMFNRNTSTGRNVEFRQGGSIVGDVSTTASGTTYNTTSDIRLKTNIEPLQATDKLMQMNPVSYAWKVDPDGPRSMGFIAQEMQEVMPEAVSTGDDDMMSMDYGRITPILVSALQDAHRKIEDLESRIAAMENK